MERALTMLALLAACGGTERRPPASSEHGPVPGRGPAELVPDLPGPEHCADAPIVTLEELGRGQGAGERVAIDGVPVVTGSICTLMACFSARGQEPCCNKCGGGYGLRLGDPPDELLSVYLLEAGRCGGYECNFHCEPFGLRPTRRYRFVGHNDFTPQPASGRGRSMFTVEKICALEPATTSSP